MQTGVLGASMDLQLGGFEKNENLVLDAIGSDIGMLRVRGNLLEHKVAPLCKYRLIDVDNDDAELGQLVHLCFQAGAVLVSSVEAFVSPDNFQEYLQALIDKGYIEILFVP